MLIHEEMLGPWVCQLSLTPGATSCGAPTRGSAAWELRGSSGLDPWR